MFIFESIPSVYELKLLVNSYCLDYSILDNEIKNIYIIHKDEDATPIAIIQFYNCSYIEWFEVFPKFRGQGYGKNIIKFLVSLYDPSVVSCVFATPLNEDVEQFWLKCGFNRIANSQKMKYQIQKTHCL